MIVYDKQSGTFTLHTCRTTYQMKADSHGVLLHLYYGPRLRDGDLGYLLQYADRGFSPNPSGSGADRVYSALGNTSWRACPPSTARAGRR